MNKQEAYEQICQRVIRKHYRAYRKKVTDPFFVDSEDKAKALLTQTLRNAREEVEASVRIDRRDRNSRQIAEIVLGQYLLIGRKYGERYYKKIFGNLKKIRPTDTRLL